MVKTIILVVVTSMICEELLADWMPCNTLSKDLTDFPNACSSGGQLCRSFNLERVKLVCGATFNESDGKSGASTRHQLDYTSVTGTCNGDTCHVEVSTKDKCCHAGIDCVANYSASTSLAGTLTHCVCTTYIWMNTA